MKKLALGAVLLGTIAMPFMASAAIVTSTGGITSISVPSTINIYGIVTRVINWMFGFLIVIGAILILIAAFIYLTSGGNEENTATAKNYIIYAVVALVVAFIARGLLAIVGYLLKGV